MPSVGRQFTIAVSVATSRRAITLLYSADKLYGWHAGLPFSAGVDSGAPSTAIARAPFVLSLPQSVPDLFRWLTRNQFDNPVRHGA